MKKEKKSSGKQVMGNANFTVDEEGIDLLELIYALMKGWKLILCSVILFSVTVVFYFKSTPETYSANALLAPAQENETAASSLLNKFGGLVAIAGVKDKSDAFMSRVLGTIKSARFLSSFIEDNNLLPLLYADIWDASSKSWKIMENEKKPSINDGVNLLKNCVECSEDRETKLYILSVKSIHKEYCALICNKLIKSLNEKFREDAIQVSVEREKYLKDELAKTTLQEMRDVLFNLMKSEKQKAMIANINKDYAFEVIDPAITAVPIGFSLNFILAFGVVCGGFFGGIIVLSIYFFKKLRVNKSL